MTNTITISEEYIAGLAEALVNATPEEQRDFTTLMHVHPQGEQILVEVGMYMLKQMLTDALTSIIEEDRYEEEEVEEEDSISDILARQITSQQLSKQIREQMAAGQAPVAQPFTMDYFRATEAPAVDLTASIKEQVAMKQLTDIIKTQVEAPKEIDLSAMIQGQMLSKSVAEQINNRVQEYTLAEVIESILDRVVDGIVDEFNGEAFSISSYSISLYEAIFQDKFYAIAIEMGLLEIVEYKPEYTAMIVTQIAGYLIEEDGYQLSFQVVAGNVCPVLVA